MNRLELTIHEDNIKLVDMYFGKESFDFLGFNNRFKRGRTRKWKWYWRLFQVPSKKAMKKMRANIKEVFQSPAKLQLKAKEMINILNPKIVGMRNYYSREFARQKLWDIDRYILKEFTKWHNRKHQQAYRTGNMMKVCKLIYELGLHKLTVN